MNKKLKNTIVILCVVLGVVALGVGTFLLLSGSPKSDKELITESISKSIGSVKESLSGEISNLFEDKNAIVKLTTDTKLSMNDGYDNQDLAFQGDFYVSLKEIYANMKLAQGLEEELNVEMLFKDKRYYLTIKNVSKQALSFNPNENENSLRNMFINKVLKDPNLDDDTKEKVILYGLSKLMKEEG